MNSTNAWEAFLLASTVMLNVDTEPNWLGLPPLLDSGPTRPEFLARKARSSLHSGQDGRVSSRSPAMPSSRNGDQNIIAARPAKYVPRVESTSWLPSTEKFLARSP